MKVCWWLICLISLAGCGTSVQLQNNAGNVAFRTGDYVNSINLYQSALITEPENATVYFNLALAYEASGDVSRAVTAYEQVILRGSPSEQSAAYFNLGNLYFRSQQLQLAIETFQESLRLDPQNNDARFNLELALALVGQPTPTPIEMQTNPDMSSVDPTSLPTPMPGAGLPPTPSPTPEVPNLSTPEAGGLSPDMVSDSRVPPNPQLKGELDVEAAKRFIIELQQFQQDNIGLPRIAVPAATPGSTRDW